MNASRSTGLILALASCLWIPRAGAQASKRISGQGRRLIGQELPAQPRDSVVWFPLNGWVSEHGKIRFDRVEVRKGKLIAFVHGDELPSTPSDPLLNATVSATSINGKTVTYRVTKINQPPVPPPNDALEPAYPPVDPTNSTLYYTLTNVANNEPYCHEGKIWVGGNPYPADEDRGVQAVPVAEVWNYVGTEGQNRGFLTMACMSGAIAKCYRWGYKGWQGAGMKSYVQACTRMAMADYCGDGVSRTVEGTPIGLFDLPAGMVSVNPAPVEEELTKTFETAWTGGPTDAALRYLKDWYHDVRIGGALCLSKKRWDTIQIDGLNCPKEKELEDPRTSAKPWSDPKSERPTAYEPREYCDYAGDGRVKYSALRNASALLINTSDFLDAALWMWTESTPAHLTTTHLIDPGPRMNLDGTARGPLKVPPLTEPLPFQRPAVALGSVFRVDPPKSVREGIGMLATGGLVELKTYVDGKRYQTATVAPSGFTEKTSEGWIYTCTEASPQINGIPLYRYRRPATGGALERHLTTTDPSPPAGWLAAGACPGGLEGYLPALSGDK